MTQSIESVIAVLEASVKKRGEVPLTNAYLLNILKMAQRWEEERLVRAEAEINEMMAEDKKWGSS